MARFKPPARPIKQPTGSAPPPVSRTQDNYTHHTSPISGPQPTAPELQPETSSPRARIKTMPDAPMHVSKFSEPVGRPKNRNDA